MIRNICVAAVAVFALAGAANAATSVIDATFDPAALNPFALNTVAIDPVTIGTGDTLDLTIQFVGGPVTIGAGSAIWFGLLTSGGSDSIETSSLLSFTGNSANLPASIGPLLQTNSFVHLGNYFGSVAVGDYSFTTANQLLDVLDAPVVPRSYDRAFFYYETTITGSAGPAVPEPATWAMLISGFGLVGATLRRRRPALA